MEQVLEIYVDRLRDGQIEEIQVNLPPDFMEVEENDLVFCAPIEVTGEGYLADESLVLHLEIDTAVKLPCSICNEPTKARVHVPKLYHVEALDGFKGAVFQYGNAVREAVLLEVPQFVECHDGKCPKRKTISKFLKKEAEDDPFHPFADLTTEE